MEYTVSCMEYVVSCEEYMVSFVDYTVSFMEYMVLFMECGLRSLATASGHFWPLLTALSFDEYIYIYGFMHGI